MLGQSECMFLLVVFNRILTYLTFINLFLRIILILVCKTYTHLCLMTGVPVLQAHVCILDRGTEENRERWRGGLGR